MAGKTISITLKKKLEKLGQERAKSLAIDAREKLTKEYINTVSYFYNDYSPTFYNRLNGLYKSFKKYYKNSHGTRYYGGIQLSENGINISGNIRKL